MSDSTRQNHQLRRLLDISRQMAATIDLTALLQTIIDAACAVLDCERATIFLYDAHTDELYSRVATGVESIRFPADRGIAGAAAQQRVVVNVADAYADARFNRDIDRRTGFQTRNLLTFPLENLQGELVGVLQALNRRNGPFTSEDEELARVLSAQAGVAVHRHFLLAEQAEKCRMARDLEIARQIQLALFPRSDPQVSGYEVAGWNRSADETGGDCYDFMPLPDGRLAMLLADATGHGIGAALVIAQCRALTRAMLTITPDLGMVAARVNEMLDHDLSDDRFVTAFIGVLDPRRHRLDYVSAGQGPVLFFTPGQVDSRGATGLPLAIIRDSNYEPEVCEFAPGAMLVLLTDGFYEAAHPAGDLFGEQRVTGYLQAHGDQPLQGLIEGLHDEIVRFSAGAPQQDDLTAVLVRRCP